MKPTIVTEGLEFPEGPVSLGPKRVALTQIRGQCVSLWNDGNVRRVARTGGGANGATLGADGALYVTLSGPGQLATLPISAEPLALYPARA